ncbi:tetratricopeptide repeat protein [candidate division KSB1 bacterium]|nr:tetratricopeptide repeat protein [candidate division KSB1 bacterium]
MKRSLLVSYFLILSFASVCLSRTPEPFDWRASSPKNYTAPQDTQSLQPSPAGNLLDSLLVEAQSVFFQKKYQTAIRKWRQFLALNTQADTLVISQTYINLGIAYTKVGDFNMAVDSFEKAHTLYVGAGQTTGAILSLRYLGNVYFQIDDFRNALKAYYRANEITNAIDDETYSASILGLIGNSHLKLGEFNRARQSFYRLMRLKQQSEDELVQGQIIAQIGVLNFYEGNLDSAEILFQRAIAIQEHYGYHAGLKISYLNLGLLHYGQNKLSPAMLNFKAALESQKRVDDLVSQPRTLLRISDVAYRRQRLVEASGWCQQALKIAEKLGDPAEQAECLRKMGLINFSWGRYYQAIDELDRALKLALSVDSPELIWKICFSMGIVREKQELYLEASEHFKQAISFIERTVYKRQIFKTLRDFDTAQDLIHDESNAYLKAIGTLIKLDSKFPEKGYLKQAFEISEQYGTRRIHNEMSGLLPEAPEPAVTAKILGIFGLQAQKSAFERMLQKEKILPEMQQSVWKMIRLREYISNVNQRIRKLEAELFRVHPDYRLLFVTPGATVDSLQKHLNHDQVLLKFQTLPDKLLVFILTKSQLKAREIYLPETKLVELVQVFHAAAKEATATFVNDKRDFANFNSSLEALADYLAPVIREESTESSELLIIPDQLLSLVPFANLNIGSESSPSLRLIQRNPIRMFNYGMHVLSAKRFTATKPLKILLLSSDDPDSTSEASTFQGGSRDAPIQLERFDWANSATHRLDSHIAQFNVPAQVDEKSVRDSYLEMPSPKESADYGRILLPQWYRIPIADSGLFILSSLNALRNDVQTDQDLLPFIECLKMMSAASGAVSLWRIPHQPQQLIYEVFYRELLNGKPPSQALRSAQLALMSDKRFSDPVFWSGFLVYGD